VPVSSSVIGGSHGRKFSITIGRQTGFDSL
jgi:hypothetical protein